MDRKKMLELAEVHETGVDEQEKHVFSDEDLENFVKAILAAGLEGRHEVTDRLKPVYELAVKEKSGVSILLAEWEAAVVDRRALEEIGALAGYYLN